MKTFNATLRTLGLILSALSVISFVQVVLDVGLASTFQSLVSFYRSVANAVFGWPVAFIGLTLPQPLVDFWTISFLGAGAYVRTDGIEKCRAFRNYNLDPHAFGWKLAVLCLFGFSGIGTAIAFAPLWPLTYADNFHEEPLDLMKGAIANLFWVCLAAVAFFVLNAFTPTT